MRAIEVREFGPPEVLTLVDVPAPEPAPGQVLVDVAHADVLWLETAVRAGQGAYFGVTPPYRPGTGAAGVVVGLGAGVDRAWLGRRVVASTGAAGAADAEQVALDVAGLTPVPDGLDLDVAAALIHDGTTARAVDHLVGLRPGDRVLATAAAGGMGVLLVQLAVAAGARVVAAARGRGKLERLADLGPAAVVDYGEPDWVDGVAAAVGELDVVLDGAGGSYGTAVARLLAPKARFSAHGTPAGAFTSLDPALVDRLDLQVTGITDLQLPPAAANRFRAQALDDARAGRIAPAIGQTYPLERAPEAHAGIENRTAYAKTLLTVRP